MAGGGGKVHLSVIIPGRNQGPQLDRTLKDIQSQVREFDFTTETIYVDCHSTDNTQEIISRRLNSRAGFRAFNIYHAGHGPDYHGKGAAVRAGMLNASGRYRMYLDSDSSTPFSEITKLLPFLDEGYQMVMGSRYIAEPLAGTGVLKASTKSLRELAELTITGKTGGNRCRKKQPWVRQVMSRGGNLAFAALLGITAADSRCGFKAYSGPAAERIFSLVRLPGFGFEEETLVIARNHGFQVIEVPVDWYDNDDSSNVKPMRDSLKSFEEIARIEWRRLTRRYGPDA